MSRKILGAQRVVLGKELLARNKAGSSIPTLAWEAGGSETFVRQVISEVEDTVRQRRKGDRIVGAERATLGKELAILYQKGVSVRQLAVETRRSYGFVRQILIEAGVELRPRGGNPRNFRDANRRREAHRAS